MEFDLKHDVVVVGGGVAGVAAALASAREGQRTLLIEKTAVLGGLATSGLILYYLPLCDGRGHQVSFGMVEELLKLSLRYSPCDPPAYWRGDLAADPLERYATLFSPAGFALALGELLVDEGVDILLDAMVCGSQVEEGRVQSVEVETPMGRGRASAQVFIDASGDASLIRRAGGAFAWGPNRPALWSLEFNRAAKSDLFDNLHIRQFNEKSEIAPGFDAFSTTRFMKKNWETLAGHYRERYASGEATRQDVFPMHVPFMPQFRKIARMIGRRVLVDDQDNQRFEDSIGLIADWCKPGPVWEVPYDILVPERLTGVLAAGRVVSSDGYAWDMTRVIPAAVVTGEAAGRAAALSIRRGCLPHRLPVSDLQEDLRNHGVKLHLDEVGLSSKN